MLSSSDFVWTLETSQPRRPGIRSRRLQGQRDRLQGRALVSTSTQTRKRTGGLVFGARRSQPEPADRTSQAPVCSEAAAKSSASASAAGSQF